MIIFSHQALSFSDLLPLFLKWPIQTSFLFSFFLDFLDFFNYFSYSLWSFSMFFLYILNEIFFFFLRKYPFWVFQNWRVFFSNHRDGIWVSIAFLYLQFCNDFCFIARFRPESLAAIVGKITIKHKKRKQIIALQRRWYKFIINARDSKLSDQTVV